MHTSRTSRPNAVGILPLAASVALLAGGAWADEPFVNTDAIRFHVHMGPPPIITAPEALLKPAENQFKQVQVERTQGAVEAVAGARRTFKAAGGYDGGGNIKTGVVQGAHRGAAGYVLGSARHDAAGAYDDGDGNRVNFGYDRTIGQLVLGYTPNATTEFKVLGLADHTDDDKQPHHVMDPHSTERHVGKAFLTFRDLGVLDSLQLHGSAIDLGRRADNYTLRTPTGLAIRMEVDRTQFEGGATADFTTGGFENSVGFRVKQDDLNAQRYNVTGGDRLNGFRFPGVEQTGFGLWGDTRVALMETTRLQAGLRYDFLHGEATKAGITTTGGPNAFFNVSPLALYQTYYGVADPEVTDHNLSGKVRLEQDLPVPGAMAYGELARLERSPREIERWHSLSGPPTSRWVGNPDLETEKHHQARAGLQWRGPGYRSYGRSAPDGASWLLRLDGHYDRVQDFVTLDIARGQSGVLMADGAIVSRNVSATLAGVTAEGQWNVTPNLSTRLVALYAYGENESDDRPLYQIRPFEANWLLDYQDDLGVIGTWNLGTKVRFSGRQTRVDDNTATGLGMDTGGTSGSFTTVDLYGGFQLYNRVGVTFGVENLLDKHYHEHITGTHVASVSKLPIYAPGRTFFVRAVANF